MGDLDPARRRPDPAPAGGGSEERRGRGEGEETGREKKGKDDGASGADFGSATGRRRPDGCWWLGAATGDRLTKKSGNLF